jgi:hypothetical protein
VWTPSPLGGGFQGLEAYHRMSFCRSKSTAREGYAPALPSLGSMSPTRLFLGMVGSLQSPMESQHKAPISALTLIGVQLCFLALSTKLLKRIG